MPHPVILTRGLEFDPERHHYWLDGRPISGVTSIIAGAGFTSPFIQGSEAAAQRGSAVHAATHYDDEGDLNEDSLLPELHGYLKAWRRFRYETGLQLYVLEDHGGRLAREVAVASMIYNFATIADCIGILPGYGRGLTAVEIKTGPPGDAAALQTAAQQLVLDENNIRVVHRVAVKLNDDGTYYLKRYVDHLRDRNDFLACLRVVRRLAESGRS